MYTIMFANIKLKQYSVLCHVVMHSVHTNTHNYYPSKQLASCVVTIKRILNQYYTDVVCALLPQCGVFGVNDLTCSSQVAW